MKGHGDIIFNSNLVLISGAIMSLFGSYYLEKEDRIKFLLNQKLMSERHELKEINILLEKKKSKEIPLQPFITEIFFTIPLKKSGEMGRDINIQ